MGRAQRQRRRASGSVPPVQVKDATPAASGPDKYDGRKTDVGTRVTDSTGVSPDTQARVIVTRGAG